jgi:uncharacterized protein YkwD
MALVACVLTLPATASAAQRFAAPGGGGGPTCPAGVPCSLSAAVTGALPADEIILAPGDYDLLDGSLPIIAAGLDIHGADGQARPTIHGASPLVPLVDVAAPGVRLRHLAIRQDGTGGAALDAATLATGSVFTDLLITNTAAEATAARLGPGVTLASSTAHAPGGAGSGVTAVGPGGPALHNVTAWGSTAGITTGGIDVVALTATNTIARAPGGTDLFTEIPATFAMSGSNWATKTGSVSVTDLGANQSADPSLANPAAGDFHQLPGSPTIDAGIPEPLAGLTDPDGEPRLTSLRQDIGADEYVPHPPTARTGDPLELTTSGGRLTGTVNPNGRATTYRFDFGPTPLYGNSTTPQSAGAGSSDVPVAAGIGDLSPGSVVHYRVVATNVDGESAGVDRVLIVLPTTTTTPGRVPGFTTLSFPTTVTQGQPFTIRVGGRDRDDPVNSIAIDFDDGPGFFAESACRLKPPDRVFNDNRATNFAIPYSFATPGTHAIEVSLGSGDCGRGRQAATQTIQVNVLSATARVSARSVVAAADCRDADLLPDATNLKKIEKATLCLLNKQRRANKLTGFRLNKRLRKAAAMHNGYMVRGKFLAHQGPGEPALGARFRKAKYRGGGGENIGVGAGTPYATSRGMVNGWMNSPVHRANILERAFHTVGIHVVGQKPIDPTLPGATYTVEFGTTRK